MNYTVKQLATLAGVSTRTLHYYDQIGLLKPARYGENGYRYYDDEAVLRLQQILFFRELDFGLDDIRAVIDRPGFDRLESLRAHKESLRQRVDRLNRLIDTIDATISHLKGEKQVAQKRLFEGFSDEKQKQYEAEIRQRYGDKAFENVKDWNRYTPQQKERIKDEGEAIYLDLKTFIEEGKQPESAEVQAAIARWHQHMRYFYEPSYDRLLGLGHMYNEHPDFLATFRKIHPDLPQFMLKAIEHYCQGKTTG